MKKRVLFFAVVAMFAAIGWAKPELHMSIGHGESVRYSAWSKDGKYIASASEDKTVRIWEASSGKEIRTLQGHSDYAFCVGWSSSGRLLASKSFKEIIVWNPKTGEIVNKFDNKYDENYTSGYLSWSPVEEQFVFLGNKGDVILYKNNTLVKIANIKMTLYPDRVSWSPNARYIAVTDSRNAIYLWDNYEKRQFTLNVDCIGDINSISWSPDSKKIAFSSRELGKGGMAASIDIRNGGVNVCFEKNREAYRLSWSPNGDFIAVDGEYKDASCFRLYNAITGQVVLSDSSSCGGLSCDSWSPDGRFLVWFENELNKNNRLTIKNVADRMRVVNSSVDKTSIIGIDLNPNKSLLAVGTKEKTVSFWSTMTMEKKWEIAAGSYSTPAWNPSGTTLVSDSEDERFQIYNLESKDVKVNNAAYRANKYAWSPNGEYVACACRRELSIFFASVYKKLQLEVDKEVEYIEFSPNGRYLACLYPFNDCLVKIWDVGNWTLVKSLLFGDEYFPYRTLAWSPDGKNLAIQTNKGLVLWDTVSWQKKEIKFDVSDHGSALAWSRDGKCLFYADCESSSILSLNPMTGRVMYVLNGHTKKISELLIDSNGMLLYSASDDGTIRVWNVNEKKLVCTTVVATNGEWLTYTPEGYFTGTDWAKKNLVYFVDGMDVVEIDQMYESFHRPDLIAAKLRGEDIIAQYGLESLSAITATGDAPFVRFVNPPASSASRDVNVSFTVQDQGGGIGGVYLTLNGKVIQVAEGSRRIEAVGASQKSVGKTFSFAQPLTLQNGENLIEAYADNAAGKIQSRRASAKITWKGSVSKPSLHVLSVGVNKYRDKSLWLQYSVPDAQAVAQAFAGQKTSLYQNVYTYQLLDGDVTKENLLAQFNTISSKVAADDVFVLFVAGHGTAHQKTGDYYFLPANFRYTDSEAIASQGVSKDDILKYMKNIKAGKTLIMLDTCNSGAFTNDKAMRGVAEKTALDRLCHSTGQAILTAASEEQSAMEGYNGHGIFTYVLLEALSGKADRNKDGYITLNELASYIDEQVPELSYQKWGYEQVPMKELRKQDFPLVGK